MTNDFSEKLNSILQNPAMMSQIKALADTMTAGESEKAISDPTEKEEKKEDSLPEEKRFLKITAGTLQQLSLAPNPPAEVKQRPETENLCGICIKDSGPGVPKALAEKIFEPFFTTKPTGKGTGMGLSMSCGVALEHDGWVQYDSDGTGAMFTLVLPVQGRSGSAEK